MATTSSCSTPSINGSSPITRIAQDHLFSILLLLPLDSIFCFAMTCKKFRSLTYSDPFWESLCRRDWGQSSIDALRSFATDSNKQQQFPWKKLYQQIYQLDSVYCNRLLTTHPKGGDEELLLPRPRASHSLNFVSGCLVLFGGGCEGGKHLDDTWVAYVGNDFKRILKWNKIESGIPSGRFGHSCVVIGDCLVLFGGINDHGARQNDTWVGQVAVHDTFGITLSWRLLDVGSIAPPPRGAHAACSIDKRRMLIQGGIGLNGLRLGDTWVLELAENLHLGVWQEIVTHPSPPSRSGHTLTHVGGNQTILFGGRGLGYEVLNDVWLFNTSEGHWRWVQLLFDLQNIPQGLALPRVGHSANLIIGGRLLIHGGEDSYRHRKDDFWVLDIGLVTSIMQSGTPSNLERSKTKLWRRLKSKGDNPGGRSFHRACVDSSGRNFYIFGGMVDGLLQPAESSGLRFDGDLFLVELVIQC
ncbi:F-box/kelch-repeat protein At1g51550-like [Nicotiana tabacum]|uniref:F-box/kelch-repeat protein At1g51550-like n=1 Tax=Nicotiana tabacum TaxID=4097 RepID=A0A1S4CXX6_TOBAC|nr:F-box/kelch-repeat protein At1g51550 [Nicotiana tomentosiformis]XP_016505993.1 PREDICTED: F-box/kelch-repeat protein At1g51550-like [Nicotiana tabacum]